jgi:ABC-type multidrug transport system fused ATPase/permease subunit
VALLRLIELSEGHIYIDKLDLASLKIREMRSRIAVIPQEPVLLTGTVRSNLDPFNSRTDEEIWKVTFYLLLFSKKTLKDVHLKGKIQDMPSKLETSVTGN